MIRRFMTRVLMVILIAVCGYNGWQVHRLQEQVDRLQAQTREPRTTAVREPALHPDASWLDQADRHAERAKDAAARADFPAAQRELALGVEDVRRAAREPVQKTQATLGQTRRELADLQSQADSLWRKIHSAPLTTDP